ncbi:Serine carboxypeptidase-like 50 [Acorus gramineus]|uniref:Carboxypeptidase n=1 Tax=Acorus gramineus TaxID=55184 RepID=A0AAV9A460_ACOGR|nr:Serine carboxypeptidase-like 50 [Acorus gramineus]
MNPPTTTTVFFLLLLHQFIATASPPPPSPPPFPKGSLPTSSGYLPINTSSSSALFFTFYEAQHPLSALPQTPILLWLQGGPGCSSMLGNLFELGPWLLTSDDNNNPSLQPNPASWNRLFGLLFIDNPIGAGFSIASDTAEIPRNQARVAEHLWIGMQAFLDSRPTFRRRPLYITGESYAGKYVPAAGYYFSRWNSLRSEARRINLRGVAIGNGLTHPVVQVATHAKNAYFSGLINERQTEQLEALQAEAVWLTQETKWGDATRARNRVLSALSNMTGLATLYDLSRTRAYETGRVSVFLNRGDVKKALGVADKTIYEECSDVVGQALHDDVMKSAKFMVEWLLRETKDKVLLYQGGFDLRDGVVSTEAWVKEMVWEGLAEFMKAERKVWEVKGTLAGYVQRWGTLSHAVVARAGHLVPADQGVNSQAMIEDWVLGNGLFGNNSKWGLGSEDFRKDI